MTETWGTRVTYETWVTRLTYEDGHTEDKVMEFAVDGSGRYAVTVPPGVSSLTFPAPQTPPTSSGP